MKNLMESKAGKVAVLMFGAAALVASSGYLIRSVPTAHANDAIGPAATGGTIPYITLSGTGAANSDNVIYTVPANRAFVLTGGCTTSTFHDLYEDGTLKVEGSSRAMACFTASADSGYPYGVVATGRTNIVFAAGSQVILKTSNSNSPYFFQGYLAHE